MFRIILSDNTVIENIGINGNTLISYEPLDNSIFENNLSPVTFEWEGERPMNEEGMFVSFMEGIHEHMTYQPIISPVEGEYWFALTDVPEAEIRYAKMRSNIDYIAMMTDVEL